MEKSWDEALLKGLQPRQANLSAQLEVLETETLKRLCKIVHKRFIYINGVIDLFEGAEMEKVVFENITKMFGDVKAVDDVSLTIDDKEFFALLGPSGCGKTTLLRMLAGLESPTEGNIYIDGKKVNDLPPNKRGIEMVFQSLALFPHKNVFNNIAFPLQVQKMEKKLIEKKVKETAELMRIGNLIDRNIKNLSGGERQRVALARSIVRDPEIFLMDEPLSSLDARLRRMMRAELIKLHEELETTIIYVTHDQVEAMTMADRMAVLKDGITRQVASPKEVYNHPSDTWVADFLARPMINFFDGEIKKDNGSYIIEAKDFTFGPNDISEMAASRSKNPNITIGVRPEDILINLESGDHILEAKASIVEEMGDSVIVLFDIDNKSYQVKTTKGADVSRGDTLYMTFDTDNVNIFDKESGMAII